MATPYATRSIRSALLAVMVIASLTTACKKSGFGRNDVDPRDQYVGTYEGTSRRTYYVSADIFSGPIPGTSKTTVTKSSNPGEIYIENTVAFNSGFSGGYTVRVTATLDGANFTVIDKGADQIELPNGKVVSDYAASGSFDAATKQFVYSATARALRNGAQYSRTDEITNTRK